MSNQLELRHLKYFLAVAEELHYRKAAEKLFISQPGLSRQIKQLEDEIGVTLFERHSRKVSLTKAGNYLNEEIRHNLKNLDNILAHAKHLNDGVVGSLRLGYVGSAMEEIIPDLLLKFRKQNPNALFSLKEMDNNLQIEGLLSQEIDVGFVRLERVPRDIKIQPLLKENFCLVLPRDHKIDTSNFKDIKQLEQEPFILFNPQYSKSYHEKVMQIFDDAGFVPSVRHNTIHAGSIFKLVENNFGVSIVPKSLQTKSIKGVKFIELSKIPQKTTLSIVWNTTNRNPILKAFINLLDN